MSIENLNIAIAYADIIADRKTNCISLHDLNKRFYVKKNVNEFIVPQISFALLINGMQKFYKSNMREVTDSYFSINEVYKVRIKLESNKLNFNAILGEFNINPIDNNCKVCEQWIIYKHIRLCLFENIKIMGSELNEEYTIKIFVKKSDAKYKEDWQLQTIYPIQFILSI